MDRDSIRELGLLKMLYSIDGIGPQKIFSLLSKFHSFEKIINAPYSALLTVEGVSKNIANKILASQNKIELFISELEEELINLEKTNSYLISYWDENYPHMLKNIYFPPLMLYVKGDINVLKNDLIAIVGTREPTQYGKSVAERFTSELVKADLTIVSGMARGIDSIAHSTALKENGNTIAVIGSGLDVIYPPENKKLFEAIIRNGCVISEYKLGTKPDAQNFPRRNRIISGLSLGTLIIETRINGGAMQTAAYALDQGREIFAVPGFINSKLSEGTNSLIKKSEAKLVTCVEDILNELQLRNKVQTNKKTVSELVSLTLFEEKIYSVLSENPMHIDDIASTCSMNTSDCLVNLLTLEFKGLVIQLPGKTFIRS